ncbi:PLD nuclease N-terminal domain-containing protein [Paenibacillus endoradicis]|uniref:PLD nuclease N-terminal domain-containing protein n=1 Tax=Paenibacillus endoradicis TaxID=2972487 RepID=UPI0021591F75|nr:PLD nuclease N-terminal domain-containing protein [Paenibacillus endoradicis]MCR8657655.1 PLD nuclease N-terminal domain-containing protein [Paenibacillus endoradicis]
MQEIIDIPWALIAPVLGIQLILMIIALIDLLKIHATNGPKWLWLVLILVSGLLGSIVYFIVGRKQA